MTAWLDHVKNVKKQNGGLQLKDVLKLASKTYKKGGGETTSVVPASEYENNTYGTVDPVFPTKGGGKKRRRTTHKKTKKNKKHNKHKKRSQSKKRRRRRSSKK
jgi:hypothetical protein